MKHYFTQWDWCGIRIRCLSYHIICSSIVLIRMVPKVNTYNRKKKGTEDGLCLLKEICVRIHVARCTIGFLRIHCSLLFSSEFKYKAFVTVIRFAKHMKDLGLGLERRLTCTRKWPIIQ